MTIYVKDSAKEVELKQLQKTLRLNSATKKVDYVSKEDASKDTPEWVKILLSFGLQSVAQFNRCIFQGSFLNPVMVSKLSKDIFIQLRK